MVTHSCIAIHRVLKSMDPIQAMFVAKQYTRRLRFAASSEQFRRTCVVIQDSEWGLVRDEDIDVPRDGPHSLTEFTAVDAISAPAITIT